MTVVRAGGYDDCPAVARTQVAAWRAGYAGVVPDDVLARLDVAERVRRWVELVHRGVRLLVAEDAGEVVGYASCGASRDDDARAGVGELYALYVAPEHWRGGTGRLLHDAAVEALVTERLTTATLWVLAGSERARAFFEALGWRPDGSVRTEQVPEGVLDECRYRRAL